LFLILALFIVLIYVIPQIKPLFETVDIDLPISTQALILTSEFFVSNFMLIILIIISIIFFFLMFKSTESGKKTIDNFVFSLPLI
jgi:type II secretory pathway component PulF